MLKNNLRHTLHSYYKNCFLFFRMLDEYFAEQMKEIVKQCARNRQTMLFSATMTTAVEDLASVSLSNPVKIFVDSNQSVTFNLRQEFIRFVLLKIFAVKKLLIFHLIFQCSHISIFLQLKKYF